MNTTNTGAEIRFETVSQIHDTTSIDPHETILAHLHFPPATAADTRATLTSKSNAVSES